MTKTVIIVPYREREHQLDFFLKHSYPLISKYVTDLEVIIVEQTKGKPFNCGAVLNIGYKYYNNPDNYYISHVVDHNPRDERTAIQYNEEVDDNRILGIATCEKALGLIVKYKGSLLEKVNGYPNDYWGWGHEDANFENRCRFYKVDIEKRVLWGQHEKKNDLFIIYDDIDDRERNNKYGSTYVGWQKKNDEQKKIEIYRTGLNTLKYNILEEKQLFHNVKHILVDITQNH
jgi:hypothetical protein